ncbi:DUF3068 domain-containing protein [Corynebacterium sp. sy017]|uniref:DUF3068 domain-containing protein n=1 Tax=unclassified Corynebacterium TaxID=2624378 RepID=UPI001186581F|nr:MULTISPECIES: DUF3068 domain-containing protein [unclassified Corynebacterium]MBP3088536.1 DUF3068 domain-containing protein [Corynebacterium sp. sy017]TSD91838.1 DUF3068 domain-containing protein [Corynebacterium sp. SY003]
MGASRSLAWHIPRLALGLSAILFLLAAVVPQLIISKSRLIPLDTRFTVSTTPAYTQVYDPKAPCAQAAQRDCYVVETQSQLTRVLETHKTDDKKETAVSVQEKLTRTDNRHTIFTLDDSLRLTRRSTYPVADKVSQLQLTAPDFNIHIDTDTFARDGVQYFYPFEPERRSYDFFDIFAQDTIPLDYVDSSDGLYVFTQKIPATNIRQSLARSMRQPEDISDDRPNNAAHTDLNKEELADIYQSQVSADASFFYPNSDEAAPTGTVVLDPFYSATRTLWVEPQSGTIVDQKEDIFLFLARNQEEANMTAHVGHDNYRTLLRTTLSWDQQTKDRAWQQANPTLHKLEVLKVLTFSARILGFILLGYGLWRLYRKS